MYQNIESQNNKYNTRLIVTDLFEKKNRCMEFECDVYVRSLFVNVLARSLIRTSTFLSRGIDV